MYIFERILENGVCVKKVSSLVLDVTRRGDFAVTWEPCKVDMCFVLRKICFFFLNWRKYVGRFFIKFFSFLSKICWTVRYESKGLNCINLITDRASGKFFFISLENKIRFMSICRINDVWTEATYPYPMVVIRIAWILSSP